MHDLEDFFEHGAISLHLVGADGTILRVNRAELEFLGYTAEEYVGHHIAEFHVDRPVIDDILQRLARGEVLRNHEARLRAKDGSIKDVLIDSSVHWQGGDFVNTRCFTRDVTHMKALERERDDLLRRERAAREEAERLNHVKDEFLATLSHELRTPLNAILGWARLLETDTLEAHAKQRAVQTIARNAAVQAQLIDDLLDMSRIIAGKLRLDVRPVSLVAVVEAVLESFRPAADAKGVRLRTALDARAAPILGDADRLQQVVWNLVSNAIKFTDGGGSIRISLQAVDSHAQLVVTDTGRGVVANLMPYIFDRFRQGDSSLVRTRGGLGIGLSLVRHLVEMHGGTVEAASPGAGLGSTFTVRLPLTTIAPVVEESVVDRAAPGVLSDLRVLVVDDEQDALELFSAMLRQHGAAVRCGRSAAEALATIVEWSPDVLISDIDMPGEDGYGLIRRVRALDGEHLRTMRAVAVTAYGHLEDRLRALAAGFQMHVTKPVEPAELVAVVASVAGRSAQG